MIVFNHSSIKCLGKLMVETTRAWLGRLGVPRSGKCQTMRLCSIVSSLGNRNSREPAASVASQSRLRQNAYNVVSNLCKFVYTHLKLCIHIHTKIINYVQMTEKVFQ